MDTTESNTLAALGASLYKHACRINRAARAEDAVDYLADMGVFDPDGKYAAERDFENVAKPKIEGKCFDGVSLGKDKRGYFVYTHRARSKSYDEAADIPNKDIAFIKSTG